MTAPPGAPLDSPNFVVVGADPCNNLDVEFGVAKLLKIGGSGTFQVDVRDLDSNLIETREVSLDDGDCGVVDEIHMGFHIVDITETSGTPQDIQCEATFTCSLGENFVSVHIGENSSFHKGAVVTFVNDMRPGRMTGGGHQIRIDGVKVTRGLTLHCDITLSNNLEINWPGGNNWHLDRENLDFVTCVDDPNFNPFPPPAPFDTFIARGRGRLNGEFGVDGSIIDFRFIDDGEPGTTDEAHFTIYAPDQGPGQVAPGDEVIVLQVSGQLDGGNLQAHFDQPHS